MESKNVPSYLITPFLSVFDLLTVFKIRLPVLPDVISRKAEEAGNFASALRFSENSMQSPSTSLIEKLVVFNQKLGLPLEAAGVVKHASQFGISVDQESLREKLGLWAEASSLYSQKLKQTPNDETLIQGLMNCLIHSHRYNEILKFDKIQNENQLIAHFRLYQYDKFKEKYNFSTNP